MASTAPSSLTYESDNLDISSTTANSTLCSNPNRFSISKTRRRKFLNRRSRDPRKRRKISPRSKLVIAFIISEVIITALCLLNLETFLLVMKKSFVLKASRELHLMDWTYNLKIDQLAFNFQSKSSSRKFLTYLESRNQSYSNVIIEDVKHIAKIKQIEYATLLDQDGHILLNINHNRTGHVWDPSGFVDVLILNPSFGQMTLTGVITFSELSKERAPLWRERVSDDQPLPLTHPYDTYGPGLLRYVITPFFSENSSVLSGILVAGDLVNGKTPIPYLTVDAFQKGFAGVFMKTTENGKTVTSPCTGSLLASIDGFDGKILTSSRDPTPLSFVEKVFENPSYSTVTERAGSWSFAAKKVHNVLPNGNELDSAAVMVRAISDNDSQVYNLILFELLEILAVILCMDLFLFLLSLKMFIRPLECLAKRLKRKSNLTQSSEELHSTFDQLQHRRRNIFFIFVPAHLLKSTLLPALVILTLKYGLKHSQGEETKSALGVANIMYNLKVDQMSLGVQGLSYDPDLRSLLDFPNNSILIDNVYDTLQNEIHSRKIEFALLIDSNHGIMYDPNRGTSHRVFDLNGLVSMTKNSGLSYKKSVVLSIDNYLELSPLSNTEQLNNSLTESKLNPYITRSSSLVRFTTTPVFATSKSVDDEKPDGVIISGDVMNGKTIFCERIIDVMEEGFCGIYMYEESRDEFELLSSLFHLPGTEDLVDYDLPEKEFLYEVFASGEAKTPGMFFQNLFSEPYIIVVNAIPQDQFISSSGQFELGREKEFAFIVYAHREKVDSAIWLWIGVSFEVIGILLSGLLNCWITYIAFKPVQKLLTKVRKLGFLKNIDENNVSGSSPTKHLLQKYAGALQKCHELAQKIRLPCKTKASKPYSPVGNLKHEIHVASPNSPPPSKWAKKSVKVCATNSSGWSQRQRTPKMKTPKTTPLSLKSSSFFPSSKAEEESWHLA